MSARKSTILFYKHAYLVVNLTIVSVSRTGDERKRLWSSSKNSLHSPTSSQRFDLNPANWRMESIVRDSDSCSDEEDEFFDCQGKLSKQCFRAVFTCLYQ